MLQVQAPAERVRTPPLTQSLLRDWSRGKVTSKQVQDYAMGAEVQGAGGLKKFGSAGSSGKYVGNIFRDLVRVFGKAKGGARNDLLVDSDSQQQVHPPPVPVAP